MEGPDVGRGLSSQTSSMEGESPPSASPSRAAPAGEEHSTVAVNGAPMSELDNPEAKPSSLNCQIECPPHDNSANFQIGTPSKIALLFGSLCTTISAGLYIFDFVSNVLVAKQFYDYDYRDKDFEGLNHLPMSGSKGNFIAMVIMMVIGHIGWGIAAFMTADLPRKKNPLFLAYFFPLLQFQRLLRNLWNPLSKGSRAPDERRVEALYAIVSAAIDGAPLFIIQYSVLAKYTVGSTGDGGWTPHPLLVLSLVLSAVSAIYNVIRAMVIVVPIRSISLGLAAGLFTLSTFMLQCISLVCLVVAASGSGDITSTVLNILLVIYVLLTLLIPFIGFYVLTRQTSSQRSFGTVAKSVGKAAGFAYVNASFGSLYPLVSLAHTSSTMLLSTKRFRYQLFLSTVYQIMLEVIFALVLTQVKSFKYMSWPCPPYGSESPLITCSIYKAFLIGGFGLQVLSVAALAALLVRVDRADGLQTLNITDAKTLLKVDGAFNIVQASFNIVDSCWGS